MDVDIDALRERFLNQVFDEREVVVTPQQIVDYAVPCGETLPRYTDPDDPDFQAPPTWPCGFSAGRILPEDFPDLGGLPMDAGKAVEPIKPIRPNVPITGRTHIHDIYTKTGRSGRMVFIIIRTEFFDPDGELLAKADTSAVHRERPQ